MDSYKVDPKSRTTLPAELRESHNEFPSGGKLVFFVDPKGAPCLQCLSLEDWTALVNTQKPSSVGTAAWTRIVRALRTRHETEVDKQGKVSLPQGLRSMVGIDTEVVFLAYNRRVEVWSPAALKKHLGLLAELQEAEANAVSDLMAGSETNDGE